MSAQCLSLEIGSRNLNAVLGSAEGNRVKITKSVSIELPRNTMNDGVVVNRERLTQSIKDVISKINTSVKDVVITLNSNSVIIREFDIPNGDKHEVEAMIKNEINQYFSMAENDLVEYRKVGEIETDGAKISRIRAAVMNKDMALPYFQLLEELKLNPVALDINPNVISKIFDGQAEINGNKLDNYILLDIGYSGTMIYLISQGSLNFFRNISFGGRTIDRLISSVFSMPEEKAEEIKLQVLSNNESSENLDSVNREQLLSAIESLYTELADELRKVIQFFSNRSGSKELGNIFLIGGGSYLDGLSEYLSQSLGYDVDTMRTFSNIQKNNDEQPISTIINAAGALIRL